ncbi:MAG: phosphoribosylanthranilate isomerase [Clostridiales Family XIII bacterium]|jgi:phosphoribosylanthranilate isomerase|nr:phosphoribosylanthranilate isomerase [Clostridiales Family XIII bacterium]
MSRRIVIPGADQGSPKIKICGIFREEDADVLNEVLPDYAGFVFAEKSHRYVTPDQARTLRNIINPHIVTVGVFVNAEPGLIADLVLEGTIGAVQLHGSEDADYVLALKNLLRSSGAADTAIIKAVPVTNAASVIAGSASVIAAPASVTAAPASVTQGAAPQSTFLLFDNGAGGTGKSFDHGVLREAAANGTLTKLPFFVAGGLNPENVSEVLDLPLFGVDVSGGVETDGVKDPEKIRRFAEALRSGGRENP